MKKKLSPTAIGVFLAGAFVLLALAIVIFGSGDIFAQRQKAVVYFKSSVSGLKVGSPVKFQGVSIGKVVSLHLWTDSVEGVSTVPVVIEINERTVTTYRGFGPIGGAKAELEERIANGLRARLETENLVTGQLYVGLDMRPGQQGYIPSQVDLFHSYVVIPTLETTLDSIIEAVTGVTDTVRQLDLKQISDDATAMVASLREKVEKLDAEQINQNVVGASEGLNRVLNDPNLSEAIAKFNRTMTNVEEFSGTLQDEGAPAIESLKDALAQVNSSLEGVSSAVDSIQRTLAPNSKLSRETISTLQDISDASRALRDFLDFLERNPNALITGKKTPAP